MSRKVLFTDNHITSLLQSARDAGAVIMKYYKTGHVVDSKEDASPVTEADRAADRLIVAALKKLTPDIPIVSEEGEKPDVTGAEYFWLVDPLDGTRSFIRGHGYFTVNIGLIQNSPSPSYQGEGRDGGLLASSVGMRETPISILPLEGGGGSPVLGIIYDPVNDAMYWGTPAGAFASYKGAASIPIHTRKTPENGKVAIISHSRISPVTEEYLAKYVIRERIPCASSIKFCRIAEGIADIYPRFGPTMEWDTAAGHAILNAAGGQMMTPDGTPFLYGKKGFLNGAFVASAS